MCVCVCGGGGGDGGQKRSFFRSLEEKSAIDINEKMCSCVVDTSSRPCAPDPDFRCVLMLLGGGGGGGGRRGGLGAYDACLYSTL